MVAKVQQERRALAQLFFDTLPLLVLDLTGVVGRTAPAFFDAIAAHPVSHETEGFDRRNVLAFVRVLFLFLVVIALDYSCPPHFWQR
jgi:hypothetical protein